MSNNKINVKKQINNNNINLKKDPQLINKHINNLKLDKDICDGSKNCNCDKCHVKCKNKPRK